MPTELYTVIAKSGAIISCAGTALLTVFVLILLLFPVIKECRSEQNCSFSSTAPEPFGLVIKPIFLAEALITIAIGIVMIRFSRWHQFKKTKM